MGIGSTWEIFATFARLRLVDFPTVGVIGAGQLARMMVAPALDLGISLSLFAGSDQESGAQVAPHVVGLLSDTQSVLTWASTCDVVTFEHELIAQELILLIEASGVKVFPSAYSFTFSQNKLAMRQKMEELGLPNPRWQRYDGDALDLDFPLVAKSISGGYDGRGVFLVIDQDELDSLYMSIGQSILLEEKLNFDYEIAVMVARSPHGQAATWAPTLTVQKNGICTQTVTPIPDISVDLSSQIVQIALKIAQGIDWLG
jgi:5-(carboxyamino)imidazole ribonucleotide synthase